MFNFRRHSNTPHITTSVTETQTPNYKKIFTQQIVASVGVALVAGVALGAVKVIVEKMIENVENPV